MSDLATALRARFPHARRAIVERGPDAATLPGHAIARRLPNGEVRVYYERSADGFRADAD